MQLLLLLEHLAGESELPPGLVLVFAGVVDHLLQMLDGLLHGLLGSLGLLIVL